MARNRTLTDIRTECYDRADVKTVTVPSTEMDSMVNGSLAELYDLLCSVDPSLYMSLAPQSISVVSGTQSYALDGAYYRTVGVDVLYGSTYYPMRRFNWSERNSLESSSAGSNPLDALYKIQGGRLWIIPSPTWNGTIRHWWIEAPPVLSGVMTWNGYAGWEEYAILDVVIKIRSKRQEDASLEMAQKQAIVERIKKMASDIDEGEPRRVRDVDLEHPTRGLL